MGKALKQQTQNIWKTAQTFKKKPPNSTDWSYPKRIIDLNHRISVEVHFCHYAKISIVYNSTQ